MEFVETGEMDNDTDTIEIRTKIHPETTEQSEFLDIDNPQNNDNAIIEFSLCNISNKDYEDDNQVKETTMASEAKPLNEVDNIKKFKNHGDSIKIIDNADSIKEIETIESELFLDVESEKTKAEEKENIGIFTNTKKENKLNIKKIENLDPQKEIKTDEV